MYKYAFAVPVKILAIACALFGVFLTTGLTSSLALTALAFFFVADQRNWQLVRSYAVFYLLLGLLLYGIRFHDLHVPVFSEFYVLMLWHLSPIILLSWDLITTPPGDLSAFLSKIHAPTPCILGVLVVFRFFPTMRAELSGIWCSMKNRGLTSLWTILHHPVRSCEYILVPMILRCLQHADQLSISAVTRGAECPGKRESYHAKPLELRDWLWMGGWVAGAISLIVMGGTTI